MTNEKPIEQNIKSQGLTLEKKVKEDIRKVCIVPYGCRLRGHKIVLFGSRGAGDAGER